jgi:uncharacterized cofD-like protein
MSDQLTAVVTVADDGGSSGRLRDELGVLPPGDLRMALSALCDDSEWGRLWRVGDKAQPACPEAVAAIDAADWVVLGPGSWFTSVLPHLLVPGLSDALHRTAARRIVVLNLSAGSGETAGMPVEQHLDVLHRHAPDLKIDAVVADPSAVEDVSALVARADELGARLLLRQVGVSDGTPRHDPLRLAAALRDVVEGTFGDVGTRTSER